MRVRTATVTSVLLACVLACGLATGCGEAEKGGEKAAADVESAGDTAASNLERSADTMKETYDEKRKEGEGRVEAAGDAYNEMLEDDGLQQD